MLGVENCVVNVPKKIIVTDDGKIYEKANTGKVILAGAGCCERNFGLVGNR